ncbi:MAG: hypothetical protein COA88_03690 [Kordia sp.]|nr:MAG: hypothetical protein COA88_03690 [Kordia sp.]
MKNTTLLLLFFISTFSYSQYTIIPDTNFESALAAYDDIPSDGQIPTANINTLTTLDISNSSISDLTGIEAFIALTNLSCSNNMITELNVFEISGLITLNCDNNSLTQLVFNSNLVLLFTSDNNLKSLDLSLNTSLFHVECQNNDLYYLNIKNGNNAGIGFVVASGNTNLSCLNVDDAVTATAGTGVYAGWSKDAGTTYGENCDIYVPDDNFEQALIDLGYDTVLDDFVTTANISSVSFLSVSNKSIDDLTGISGFTSLLSLYCSSNNISLLDLRHNINLVTVSGRQNQFKGLYVQNSPSLKTLDCLGSSQLGFLDITQNTVLETLDCINTGLSTIDVTQNIVLDILKVGGNLNLLTLDISQNTNLTELSCYSSGLTDLDVSNNTLLLDLDISNNDITAIDLKQNTLLTAMNANPIGFPSCIQVADAIAANAGTGIYTTWTKSAGTSYSEFCLEINTYVPDDAFEQKLIDLGYDTILDDYVITENINTVISLNINNLSIANLTGIEAFTVLEKLNCNNNSLTSVDISQNINLLQFKCFNNSLTSLDVLNNVLLTDLRCGENMLTNLDISQNINLIQLRFQTNQINEIYVDILDNLEILYGHANNLTRLNITTNTALTTLHCYNNDISALDLTQNTLLTTMDATLNTNLSCIQVSDATAAITGTGIYATWLKDVGASYAENCGYVQETFVPDDAFEQELINIGYDTVLDNFVITANISGILTLDVISLSIADLTGIEDFSSLSTLRCQFNTLTNLDLSNNTSLSSLFCSDNILISLIVPNSINTLYCYNNSLATLDLTATDIKHLRAYSNDLTAIDLTNNPNLDFLMLGFNNLTNLDINNNLLLETLSLEANSLTSLDLRYHTALTAITVSNNDLTELNLKNKPNLTNTMNATNNTNLTCIQVDDVAAANANVVWFKDVGTSYSLDCNTNSIVSPKVFLQGPLLSPDTVGLMNDDLRVNDLIPTTSPYSDGLKCESSIFNITGNNAIVDWVWVELRDQANNTNIIEGQSALLQRDGDIVTTDGVSDLIFNADPDNYYAAIKHRNHLGIISTNIVALSGTPVNLNFTDANNQITFGSNAQTTYGMPTDTLAMWAGNAGGDTSVRYLGSGNDSNTIKDNVLADSGNTTSSNLHSFTGYNPADINLDGTIRYQGSGNDTNTLKDIILAHPDNQSSPSNLFIILEQFPEN